MVLTKHSIGVSRHVGNYSDAVVVSPNARWLYTAGTAPLTPEGVLPDGIEAQAQQVWKNVFATLEAGGMKPEDLVKTVSYVTRAEDIAGFIKVRAKWLGDIRPAQMMLLTPGFINPEFLCEVEAWAAAE